MIHSIRIVGQTLIFAMCSKISSEKSINAKFFISTQNSKNEKQLKAIIIQINRFTLISNQR